MKKLLFLFGVVFAATLLCNSALAISDIQLTVTDAAGNTKGTEMNPVSTCPGPITVQDVRINIRNLGADTDSYSISMTLPEGWDGAIQSGLVLASGEMDNLDLFYVNIPYTQLPGKYSINIKVESNTNPSDEITKEMVVEVLGCHIVELNLIDTYKETCQETPGSETYKVELTNKGKWEEEFQLSSSKSWVTFSQSRITLSSQETKQIDIVVTPPDNLAGEQVIDVSAKSVTSYATDKDEIKIFLIDCYGIEAGISPLEHSVCVGRFKTYTLTLENTGTDEDTFMLTSPDWVELSQKEITIPAGQVRQVEADVTPSSAGRVNFDIVVVSKNDPDAKVTVTGSITAEECRGVAVILSPTEVTACEGSDVKFNLAVKNTGTIENQFTVESSLGSVSDGSLTLGPGETKSTTLTIDTENMTGEQSVKVKVTDGVVSDQATATMILEECYSANIAVVSDKVTVCPCGKVEFSVVIENTGKLPDTYTIEFEGEKKEIQVASGDFETVLFDKEISCDSKDNKTFAFEVTSEHIGYSVHGVQLNVRDKEECYSVHLLTEGTLESIEDGRATAIKLILTNDGQEKDSYDIDVTGPSWAYVSPVSAELEADKSKDVYLYVSPPFGTDENDYEITVAARSSMASSGLVFSVSVDGEGEVTVGEIVPEIPEVPEPEEPEENVTENVTIERPGDVTLNVSFGNDSVTGELTAVEERPFWKTVTVAVITLVIILILVVRFAFLFKK